MAENAQQNQVQLRIDESKMSTTYANTIRTTTTPDEVILDFGMNLPMQMPDNRPGVLFAVGNRTVLNWAGAKRLAITLGQTIRRYEEQNGEIQIPSPQAQAPAGG